MDILCSRARIHFLKIYVLAELPVCNPQDKSTFAMFSWRVTQKVMIHKLHFSFWQETSDQRLKLESLEWTVTKTTHVLSSSIESRINLDPDR